jgi:UDP-N-acetylglucosamine diphosphorylase/glucosamine-1-phosphate N-acetyltransferase
MGMALDVVILAAGRGRRMRSPLPKVLHEAAGEPLLAHVLAAARGVKPARVVVVIGYGAAAVRARFADVGVEYALQSEQLGTGHALAAAAPLLANAQRPVLVLSGDGPLITTQTLERLLARFEEVGEGMALVTYLVEDARGLGRVVRDGDGSVRAIVEERDADAATLQLREVNPGSYIFDARVWPLLASLGRENAAGEYYLTDLVAAYRDRGWPCHALLGEDDTRWLVGVNDLEQLALADRLLRARRA